MAAIGNDGHRSFDLNEKPRECGPSVNGYYHLEEISSGAYGVVRKAQDNKTGETVAIKEEFDGLSKSTAREISILRSLPRHPSIVEFKDVIVDDEDRVFVVMEYMETDLNRLMQSRRWPFTASGVKTAMRQILEGVAFLHDHGVMHRDIKPSNILVSDDETILKLCDFGLSRRTSSSESGAYTPGVVTQWYRAPELLMGKSVYSSAIDIWSVGCVMAEMVLGRVLFSGESELQQLRYMCNVMGTPGLLRIMVLAAAVFEGAPQLTAAGIDLLQRLLAGDLYRRIAAREALNHDWFKEVD